MRRILTLLLVTALTLVVLPSFAGDAERTVTRAYTITRGHIHFNSQNVGWMGTQAEIFRARQGEESVTIALSDDTGRPVRGRVQIGGEAVEFCSETSEPIEVSAGSEDQRARHLRSVRHGLLDRDRGNHHGNLLEIDSSLSQGCCGGRLRRSP